MHLYFRETKIFLQLITESITVLMISARTKCPDVIILWADTAFIEQSLYRHSGTDLRNIVINLFGGLNVFNHLATKRQLLLVK